MKPVMDAAALGAFLAQAFPHNPAAGEGVESVEPGMVRMSLRPNEPMLRPGGIVSGPTQMGLADRAAYAVVLAHIGPVAMAGDQQPQYQFAASGSDGGALR